MRKNKLHIEKMSLPVSITSPSINVMMELIQLIRKGILNIMSLVDPFCLSSSSTWIQLVVNCTPYALSLQATLKKFSTYLQKYLQPELKIVGISDSRFRNLIDGKIIINGSQNMVCHTDGITHFMSLDGCGEHVRQQR